MLAGQGKKYHSLILSTFGKPSTFDATIEEKKKLNLMACITVTKEETH